MTDTKPIFPGTLGSLLALSSPLLGGNSAPTLSAGNKLGQNDSAAVGMDAERGQVVKTITNSEPGAADTAGLSQPRSAVAPAFGCGHLDCVSLTVHHEEARWLLGEMQTIAARLKKKCEEEQAKRGYVMSIYSTNFRNAMTWVAELEEQLGIE